MINKHTSWFAYYRQLYRITTIADDDDDNDINIEYDQRESITDICCNKYYFPVILSHLQLYRSKSDKLTTLFIIIMKLIWHKRII